MAKQLFQQSLSDHCVGPVSYTHLCMEMVLVTSDYWNAVHGADPGEVQQDIEGVEVIEKLGRNIAWMLKVIDKAGIEPPETHPRTMFNYIR